MNNINFHKLLPIVLIGLGIILAWIAGNSVAVGDYASVAMALVIPVFAAIISLGKRIYLLIPICWVMIGTLPFLPIPFNVREITIILGSGLFIQEFIFKSKSRERSPWTNIDVWIWINIVYIATVFLRNPVGFAFMSSGERVGGKPYIDVILGVMTYLILSNYKISSKISGNIPQWVLLMTIFESGCGLVGTFFPSLGNALGHLYSSFYPGGSGMDLGDSIITTTTLGEDRFACLGPLGLTLIVYIVSLANPVKMNLKQLASYLTGLLLIMFSGFRSILLEGVIATIIGSLIRNLSQGIFKTLTVAIIVSLSGILLSYSSIKLPYTFQRALSFLPGNWDLLALGDARDSSEWRFEMWMTVLTSDQYIHNKILGDGFGFLRTDLEKGLDIMLGKTSLSELDMRQEQFMRNGDFHSGPISAIRFVGVVGLLLYLILIINTAFLALNIIKIYLGKGYDIILIFYGITAISSPFIFVFIFGDYRISLVDTLLLAGMLKSLQNSIKTANQ